MPMTFLGSWLGSVLLRLSFSVSRLWVDAPKHTYQHAPVAFHCVPLPLAVELTPRSPPLAMRRPDGSMTATPNNRCTRSVTALPTVGYGGSWIEAASVRLPMYATLRGQPCYHATAAQLPSYPAPRCPAACPGVGSAVRCNPPSDRSCIQEACAGASP